MGTINKFFSQEIISISIPVLLIFFFTISSASGSNITSTGVIPDPNPPVFTECPTLVILYQICIPVSFTVTVMDQETGPVQLTASGLPPDAETTPALPASGNPVSIDFYWMASPQTLNFYFITFTATDSSGNQTNCQMLIDFPLSILSPPFFFGSPCGAVYRALAYDTITFPVKAYDTNGERIILSSSALPPGAMMTPTLPDTGTTYDSSVFFWVPDLSQEGLYSVTFTASDYCGHQTQCIVSFDVVLPAELLSFTSSLLGNDVFLYWTTSSETNNAAFEIERSAAGADDWSSIALLQGSGNSNVPFSYSYRDRDLEIGTYIYRLKQIDFNGNFEYHVLDSEVSIVASTIFSLSQNYPNPFNPTTNLEYGISESGMVSLKVYDISGKEIMKLVNEVKPAGYYTVKINGTDLSGGIYFYTLSAGNFSSTKRMLLLK